MASSAENIVKFLPNSPEPGADDLYIWMGGSFSPPTIAHIEIAALVGEKLSQDNPDKRVNVFFVPVNDNYKKDSVVCVTANDRVAMLHEAAQYLNEKHIPNVNFYVSLYEIIKGATQGEWFNKEIKTYESIKQFTEYFGAPSDNIYLMQGQDNTEGIVAGKWTYSYDLLFNAKIICIPRTAANNIVNATRTDLQSKVNLAKLNAPESTQTPDAARPPITASDVLERITILEVVPRLVSSTDLRKTIRTWYRKSANNVRNRNAWSNNAGVLNRSKTSTIKPILDYILERRLYEDEVGCETKKGGRRTRKTNRRKDKSCRR